MAYQAPGLLCSTVDVLVYALLKLLEALFSTKGSRLLDLEAINFIKELITYDLTMDFCYLLFSLIMLWYFNESTENFPKI
jgi:hypothetical protein